MDPITVKFIQLILAEVAGFGLCVAGIVLFIRGVSGKSNFVLEGAGLKAKLTNATPGGLILLVGVVVIALSLNSSVERIERSTSNPVLDHWLQQSAQVNDQTPQSRLSAMIVGADPNSRLRVETMVLDKDRTLGSLAEEKYRDRKFWRLIAVVNKDRGYFKLSNATEEKIVRKGKVLEVWLPSVYDGMTVEQRVKVSGENRSVAYDELLQRAKAKQAFDPNALTDEYRKRELDLAYTEVPQGDLHSLREVSIKYYGDAKYWPIVKWANADVLPSDIDATSQLPAGKTLHVIHFIGWPR